MPPPTIPSGAIHWCNGCYCGNGPYAECVTAMSVFRIFCVMCALVLILTIFCYCLSKLNQHGSEWLGYIEVVYNGDPKKLNLPEQTCAVCLEDFKVKDEMAVCPCQHGFHKKCLVKCLKVRRCCPTCNKTTCEPIVEHWVEPIEYINLPI
uniref:RING-type domain-containing protein n=1 Tax=Gasterosteus aculeatus TaxID=69293 RepID=G3NSX3_GASAC|nr:RING finger protein 122-like isoform X1 [Gasterosteus aculeatus aculeatus]